MSKSSVQQVIQRAVSDAAFRRQLQREPAKALAGFDLTADERASIAGGDPARLTALGVDQRMSKAFALGAAADASTPVSFSSIDNVGTSGSAAFIDETSSGATRGLIGDTTTGASSVNAGTIGDTTSGATSVFASDSTTGATSVNEAVVDGSGPQLDPGTVSDTTSGATSVIPGDTTVGAVSDIDSTPDSNLVDAGLTGESTDVQVAGTQVSIDDGQTAFESDGGATFGTASDVTSSGDDMGIAPSIDPMPSFDGQVTIDDGGDSLTQ